MTRPKLLDDPRLENIMAAIEEGQSKREICIRFDLNPRTLQSLLDHLKIRSDPDTDKAAEALKQMEMESEDVAPGLPSTVLHRGGMDVMDEIWTMREKAIRLGRKAEESGKLPQAISALRESIRIFELMTKLADQLRRNQDYNPWRHPDIIEYQEGLIEILRRHPAALEDVVAYIERFSSRSQGSDQTGKSE